MAVSPIGPVRQVLEYAISEMPAAKIMMGQNLYGYDWTLPYIAGGPYAKALVHKKRLIWQGIDMHPFSMITRTKLRILIF